VGLNFSPEPQPDHRPSGRSAPWRNPLPCANGAGGEYPAVVLALLPGHYMLLQRNLLHTGVTRARRLCCSWALGAPSPWP
jgi:hypothetical protein